MEIAGGSWQILGIDDHIATADIKIVLENQRYGLWAEGFLKLPVEGPDLFDGTLEAGGKYHDFLPDTDDPARNLTTESTEIME